MKFTSFIQSLKNGKSFGPNSIPITLLKLLTSQIMLRITKMIPVYKRDLTNSLSNHRPISLLSVFSKIIEKVMYHCLYRFLEVHQLLFNMQFGFRNGYSTDHALVSLA